MARSLYLDIITHRHRIIDAEDRAAALARREIDALVQRLARELRDKLSLIRRSRGKVSRGVIDDARRLRDVIRTLAPDVAATLESIAAQLLPVVSDTRVIEAYKAVAGIGSVTPGMPEAKFLMGFRGASRSQIVASLRSSVPNLFSKGARAATTRQFIDKFRTDVTIAVSKGHDLSYLVGQLSARGGAARVLNANAEALARTAILQVSNNAALTSYRKLDAVVGVQWDATFDRRTCPRCGAMHGRIFNKNDAPPMPAHPRCRCAWLPVTKMPRGQRVEVYRASDNRLRAPADARFEEWLRGQSPKLQENMLGSHAKWEAWRSGRLDLHQFISIDGSIITDVELRARLARRR